MRIRLHCQGQLSQGFSTLQATERLREGLIDAPPIDWIEVGFRPAQERPLTLTVCELQLRLRDGRSFAVEAQGSDWSRALRAALLQILGLLGPHRRSAA